VSKECLTVFKDFAEALINPAKCNAPANKGTTGCAMLGDLKQFVGENADVLMDMLQFTLMACGLVPGAGEACDAIDAAISFGRGDWVGGLLSAGATLPVAGWLATGAKAWKNSDKFRNIKNILEKLKRSDSCPVPAPNSFVAGTRVLLGNGGTKPIEDVRVGDAVLATDPARHRTAAKPVTATIGSSGTKRLVDVGIDEDGDADTAPVIISATLEHPFWVPSRRAWVPAGALVAGWSVLTADGDLVRVTAVTPRTATTSVYNFTVADLHTYYVLAGAAPVLVHNVGPFCGTPFGATAGDEIFHDSGYSLDEMVEFVHGHTGGGNPAMGRPSYADIEAALRNTGPVKLDGQNAAKFEHNGVRVIINYDMPWRSTAYYPGR
jgi:hypothetical protein